MKLTHIRDVLAVAELGSMRAAARHLQVAQPALTRSIQEIERELGVSLFERHARGVTTTPLGDHFLRRARIVRSELDRATEEIAQLSGGTTGQVVMAASTAPTIALMPSAMAAFRKQYPGAVLKVTESLFSGIEAQLLDGTIDFYVGPFDPGLTPASLQSEKLFEYNRFILARKGNPLAQASSIANLADAQWVRPLALSENHFEADFDELFEARVGAPPKIVMYAHSALMTLMMVSNSDLVTILPQQWLEVPLPGDQLVRIEIAEQLPPLNMCVVRRRGMPLTPMAEYMSDAIRRAAAHYAYRIESLGAASTPGGDQPNCRTGHPR